jgi:hypothetical protein
VTSKLLLWFNEISKEDVPLVGGKSASLGEMTSKTKVPVPYGFALTADAYRLFIRENGIENKMADALKPLTDSNDTVMLQKVGAQIRGLITSGKVPRELEKEITPQETSTKEGEFFEKIELEEILEKVEQLRPSLEKEWPAQSEVRDIDEMPFTIKEPAEKHLDLSEFQAALQQEAEAAPPEEEFHPISESSLTEFIEEPKREIPEQAVPLQVSAEEEELKELPEEEFPDELLEEMLGEEEISIIGEPEEVRPTEVRAEAIKTDRLEELEAPGIFAGEEAGLVKKIDSPTEEVASLSEVVDKHLEEVLAKGIQDMVGDFITKILPEMTQHIIGLTAERIEQMVKEVVPDLAEKAIQEEIKRLQKGEKE